MSNTLPESNGWGEMDRFIPGSDRHPDQIDLQNPPPDTVAMRLRTISQYYLKDSKEYRLIDELMRSLWRENDTVLGKDDIPELAWLLNPSICNNQLDLRRQFEEILTIAGKNRRKVTDQ